MLGSHSESGKKINTVPVCAIAPLSKSVKFVLKILTLSGLSITLDPDPGGRKAGGIRNITIRDLKSYLDAGVVKAGVEHDNGEGEDVAGVRIGEYVRIQLAVPEENILELLLSVMTEP